MPLHKGGECGVELALSIGPQDEELHSLRARRFLHRSDLALGSRVVRVHEQGKQADLGNQLEKQFEPLGYQLDPHQADPREISAWPGDTGDQAVLGRVGADYEDEGDRRGRSLRRQRRNVVADRHDHIDSAADQIDGQRGQPIIVTLRPAVFDRQVLALDIAGFAQPLAERGQ